MAARLPTAAELRAAEDTLPNPEFLTRCDQAANAVYNRMREVVDTAERSGRRDWFASERREFDRLNREFDAITEMRDANTIDYSQIVSTGPEPGDPCTFMNGRTMTTTDPNSRVLARSDSVTEWARRNVPTHRADHDDLSIGKMLRGWMTSRWDGAEREQRALLEGTQAGGGVLVPTPLSAQIIDRARNASRCFQAGARIVPMTSQTLKVPRIAGSPGPAWRDENATIAEGDLTFDSITFTARSMALIVKASRELVEDGTDVDGVVARDLAAQVATEIDRVMLRGSGVAPEPTGIRNTSGVTVTAFGGANGATPTNYDHYLDAIQVVRSGNFEPNAVIQSPRSSTTLSKLKEATTNAYLAPPPQMAALPVLTTNQVPTNLTAGTSNDTSEIYVGDFSNLWLGMRTELILGTLVERYADQGQIAFIVWVRADVQLAQPGAFNVITGVRP